MAGNVREEYFYISGPYLPGGGGTVGTYTMPVGSKAIIISMVLNTVGSAISGSAETSATLTASGGQTGIICYMGAGAHSVPGQGYMQSNNGKSISPVLDASSEEVTLTLTVDSQSNDECTASIVGKFIS